MSAILDWMFGVNDLTAQGAASDAQLATLNSQELASGAITQAEYDQSSANLAKSDSSTYSDQMTTAFGQGWNEGYNAETNGIKSAINGAVSGVTGFVWSSIPWWVWVVAGVVVLGYLGILQKLLKR
jgi:hypothetical protein